MGWVIPWSHHAITQAMKEMDFFHFFESLGECCFIHFILEPFQSFQSTQEGGVLLGGPLEPIKSFISFIPVVFFISLGCRIWYFFHFISFFCVFHFFQDAGYLISFISFGFLSGCEILYFFHFFHFFCVFHFFQGVGSCISFISFRVRDTCCFSSLEIGKILNQTQLYFL